MNLSGLVQFKGQAGPAETAELPMTESQQGAAQNFGEALNSSIAALKGASQDNGKTKETLPDSSTGTAAALVQPKDKKDQPEEKKELVATDEMVASIDGENGSPVPGDLVEAEQRLQKGQDGKEQKPGKVGSFVLTRQKMHQAEGGSLPVTGSEESSAQATDSISDSSISNPESTKSKSASRFSQDETEETTSSDFQQASLVSSLAFMVCPPPASPAFAPCDAAGSIVNSAISADLTKTVSVSAVPQTPVASTLVNSTTLPSSQTPQTELRQTRGASNDSTSTGAVPLSEVVAPATVMETKLNGLVDLPDSRTTTPSPASASSAASEPISGTLGGLASSSSLMAADTPANWTADDSNPLQARTPTDPKVEYWPSVVEPVSGPEGGLSSMAPLTATNALASQSSESNPLQNGASTDPKVEYLASMVARTEKEPGVPSGLKDGAATLRKTPIQEKPILVQRIISAPPQAAGTPVANYNKSMSFEDKQNNFAATDKQFLPEPSAVAAGVAKIDQKRGQKSVLADGDLKIQGSQTLPVNSAVVQAASPETEVQAAHATKMATLTHLITSEVAVMHQFKPDKLEVVLRPDSQTQILLQLNMKEGKIDGTARCDQGDFSLLSTHWAELQRTMEGQGVRLAPLREAGSGFYSGQNFQGSSHSQQQERNPAQTVISEFAKGMLTGAPKASLEAAVLASSRNDQLLQMWA